MKKILFLLCGLALVSCKKENEAKASLYPEEQKSAKDIQLELGKEIFEGKGVCYTCHKPEVKTVGPAVMDIAKIYKEKGGSISDFLQEKSEPIVDPSQYATMKTNFAITKNLPEEELKALEAYMLSFSK
jgi:cytochrome c